MKVSGMLGVASSTLAIIFLSISLVLAFSASMILIETGILRFEVADSRILVKMPFIIKNNGLCEIRDFTLKIKMFSRDGRVLDEKAESVLVIAPGSTVNVECIMEFGVDELIGATLEDLLLILNFEASLKYAGLINALACGNMSIMMGAPWG